MCDPHPAGVIEGRSVSASAVNGATRAFVASRELAAKVERREPSEAFGGLLRSPPVDDGCPVRHASAKDGSWKERALWGEHVRFLPRY